MVRHVARVLPLLLLAVVLLPACSPTPAAPSAEDKARTAAERFLNSYVSESGRVVRRDQGGDTVSEGQAYALLIAHVAERPETFRRVWEWSRTNLLRPDGLMAFHARPDGSRIDEQAATDADLIAAWALLRFAGPGDEDLRADGRRLAAAVLTTTFARGQEGLPLLTAGPWATGRTPVINASYWAPALYGDLFRHTGDPRWRELADATPTWLRRLTQDGRTLPPNWARLEAMSLQPLSSPAPDVRGEADFPTYGLDAQRTVVWAATGCDPALPQLASAWGTQLRTPEQQAALILALDGRVVNPAQHPLALVGSAAGADAAGRRDERDALLDRATALEEQYPSYYGSAWVALGRILLATERVKLCS